MPKRRPTPVVMVKTSGFGSSTAGAASGAGAGAGSAAGGGGGGVSGGGAAAGGGAAGAGAGAGAAAGGGAAGAGAGAGAGAAAGGGAAGGGAAGGGAAGAGACALATAAESSRALVAPHTVKVRIARRGVEWSIIVFHHFVCCGPATGSGTDRNQGNVPIGVEAHRRRAHARTADVLVLFRDGVDTEQHVEK